MPVGNSCYGKGQGLQLVTKGWIAEPALAWFGWYQLLNLDYEGQMRKQDLSFHNPLAKHFNWCWSISNFFKRFLANGLSTFSCFLHPFRAGNSPMVFTGKLISHENPYFRDYLIINQGTVQNYLTASPRGNWCQNDECLVKRCYPLIPAQHLRMITLTPAPRTEIKRIDISWLVQRYDPLRLSWSKIASESNLWPDGWNQHAWGS